MARVWGRNRGVLKNKGGARRTERHGLENKPLRVGVEKRCNVKITRLKYVALTHGARGRKR